MSPTLGAKALPPEVSSSFVPRPALEARLGEAMRRRLTTVVGGAGTGKSTLLAAWARGVHSAWYTLDPGDEHLSVIAPGLLDCIGNRVTGLSADAWGTTGASGKDLDASGGADTLATRIAEALRDHLEEDLALVLDDFHELSPASPSVRLVESLVRQAPARLHTVLSSRNEPPFPVQRLRGRGEVLSIDASELAFSKEEVAGVLASSVGPGSEELSEPLHELTEGWPAAIRLAAEALRSAPGEERDRVLQALRGPKGALFAYLAEEVFGRERPEVRELLSRVAHFDRFTVELCVALGFGRASDVLEGLVKRGLFIRELTGETGWFALHALVREFALRSWALGDDGVRDLHLRAARWFEERGELEPALRSLRAGGDHAGVARVLSRGGSAMVAGGQARSVIEAAEALPEEFRNPSIDQVLGEAYMFVGSFDRARAAFRRAGGGSESLPPGLASLMSRLDKMSRPGEALRVLVRARLDGSDPVEECRALAELANATTENGQADWQKKALAYAIHALRLAEAAGNDESLSPAHAALGSVKSAAGDPRAALRHLRAALEAAERGGNAWRVMGCHTNIGMTLVYQGRWAEGLEALDVAIRLGERIGLAHTTAHALQFRGDARLHLGRMEEAREDYEASGAIYARIGSLDLASALIGLGELNRVRGNLALARASYEKALALAEDEGRAVNKLEALSGLARVLAIEEPVEAEQLAGRAVAIGPTWGFVGALVAAGWVALARGERDVASSFAGEAARVATQREEPSGMAEAMELEAMAAPDPRSERGVLEEALGLWRELGDALGEARVELALARLSDGPGGRAGLHRAKRRLQTLGIRPTAAGAAGLLAALGPERPEPIVIQALGGFRVLREGKPIPQAEWQSKKARDLLKFLISRRGRPAPKELLMETLWPEEDPEKLPHRLAVAVSTLRRVLDPDRRHPQEHFIAAHREAVGVELSNLSVDVEEFLEHAREGLALVEEGRLDEAVAFLEAAEAAYSGEFLEEDPYEDWASPRREEARQAYVAVARALADAAALGGSPEAANRYWLRILERDPYDEEVHLRLVGALDRAGRHGEASRRYRAYAANMAEIGVEPASFTAPEAKANSP